MIQRGDWTTLPYTASQLVPALEQLKQSAFALHAQLTPNIDQEIFCEASHRYSHSHSPTPLTATATATAIAMYFTI